MGTATCPVYSIRFCGGKKKKTKPNTKQHNNNKNKKPDISSLSELQLSKTYVLYMLSLASRWLCSCAADLEINTGS